MPNSHKSLLRVEVPHHDGMVKASRHHLLAVRAEGEALHGARVPSASRDLRARTDVPDLHQQAGPAGGQEPVVGREAHTVNLLIQAYDSGGVGHPQIPVGELLLLPCGQHRRLVRGDGQAVDAPVLLPVRREPLLRGQVPGQQAAVAAHRDGVLVVREQLHLVHAGAVLLQVRGHLSRPELPDPHLALRSSGHDEARVGGHLHGGHAPFVGVVDLPEVLALHAVERHEAAVAAAGHQHVLRARYGDGVGPRPHVAPQPRAVVVGVPERDGAVPAA
mmetsp:Transcript_171165/g.416183  ORF Transcript_171165/g.416183 Transcript_171165/m.416183 type:complete len:275 (+) Transcript_171165:98-922(+)